MSLRRRISFRLWYLRHPPWDHGIVPPELLELISTHSPGRALDLGCGTGTSSLALARAGWRVTGVDFIPHAIRKSRRKAASAGLSVDFRVANVTRLPAQVLNQPRDLVLDIGCFHGLTSGERTRYLENLIRLLAPGGNWLIYGFFGPGESPLDGSYDHLPGLRLEWRRDGMERNERPAAWLCYGS